MMHVSFAPLVTLSLSITLVAGLCALSAVVFYKKKTGRWYRLLASLVVAITLFDPQLVFEEREAVSDTAVIVVDRSSSQQLGLRKAQTDAALATLLEKLKALPRLDIRVHEVNDAGNDGTLLFQALDQSLRDLPSERVAGAFFITDGQVHDVPQRADRLALKAPLHVLITGHEKEHDRRIVLLDSPRFGLVGKEQLLRFRIEEKGGDQKPMKALVRRDGVVVAEGRIRAHEEIKLPVTIEHAGANLFEIEIEVAATELTAANNRALVTIEGIREALKVLLVSGQPHIGERVWRNLLKADQSVDLVHFTILRPPEKQDGTPLNELSLIAFPTRDLFETRINQFDLIFFDRYSHLSILPSVYLSNIVKHVRAGGALLVAAGPEFRGKQGLSSGPLAAILPAEPTGTVLEKSFVPRMTALGQRHPVTLNVPGHDKDPPDWAPWLRLIEANTKTGVPVMSDAEGRPLLLLSHEQKGRVALLLSDHIWLWARNVQNGGPYLDLLRPIVHWLMKEPDLEEEALRAKSQSGHILVERQSLADQVGPMTLTGPSGSQQTLTLSPSGTGRWSTTVPATEWGLYHLRDGRLTAFAHIGPANPRELSEVVSTPALLDPVSRETGGATRRIGEAGNALVHLPVLLRQGQAGHYAGEDYMALKDNNGSLVKAITIKPLFGGIIGLMMLLISILLAWWAEGGFPRPRAHSGS
jgi:hypothetical protein